MHHEDDRAVLPAKSTRCTFEYLIVVGRQHFCTLSQVKFSLSNYWPRGSVLWLESRGRAILPNFPALIKNRFLWAGVALGVRLCRLSTSCMSQEWAECAQMNNVKLLSPLCRLPHLHTAVTRTLRLWAAVSALPLFFFFFFLPSVFSLFASNEATELFRPLVSAWDVFVLIRFWVQDTEKSCLFIYF